MIRDLQSECFVEAINIENTVRKSGINDSSNQKDEKILVFFYTESEKLMLHRISVSLLIHWMYILTTSKLTLINSLLKLPIHRRFVVSCVTHPRKH